MPRPLRPTHFLKSHVSRKILLPTRRAIDTHPRTRHGALAQLVEHLHGMQGVSGSNPLRSTSRIFNGLGLRKSPVSRKCERNGNKNGNKPAQVV